MLFKKNSILLLIGVFTLLFASFLYVTQDVEVIKAKDNSLTETKFKPQGENSKIYNNDRNQVLKIPYDLNNLDPYFEIRNEKEQRNIKNVVLFYSSFNPDNFDTVLVDLLTKEYIQHNPTVPTGKDGFIEAFAGMSESSQENNFSLEIKRVYADGDYVFTHSLSSINDEIQFAVVDIFRLDQNGLIAEHWDVVQEIPETSANDNTMFYLE